MKYTEDQEKAIHARGRNILVAAAAGSGKTRVLVERIIYQLLNKECSIEELLVVTFTKAAALEMRERIEQALAQKIEGSDSRDMQAFLEKQMILLPSATISTFHGFCKRVIRENLSSIDLDPQFRQAKDAEIELLKRDTLEAVLEEAYEEPAAEDAEAHKAWESFIDFVDDYGDDSGDDKVYDAVLKLYRSCQSQPFPRAWLEEVAAKYDTDAPLSGSDWMRRAVDDTVLRLSLFIDGYDALHAIVPADAEPDLQEAWVPYEDLVNHQVEAIEAAISRMKEICEERPADGWIQIQNVIGNIEVGKVSGHVFASLRDNFHTYQAKFMDSRRKLNKKLNDWKKSNVFSESEEEIRLDFQRTAQVVRAYVSLTERFMEAYRAAKKEKNIVDYDDLEHLAMEILCADPAGFLHGDPLDEVRSEAAAALCEQISFIMVDEYQDTNGVQEAILSLIARQDNRFIVGDVKQSIYRFRQADPSLFQRKYDAYPEDPVEGSDQLITMKQNFRSRAEVLDAINFFFDQMMTRSAMEIEYDAKSRLYPGFAYPERENALAGSSEVAVLLKEGNGDEEAADAETETDDVDGQPFDSDFAMEGQYISDRIIKLIASGAQTFDKDAGGYHPLEYRDIAILVRAIKGKGDTLLEVLQQNGIPAYAEMDGGYFEASEVRLMVSLLSILDNARQDIPLASVMLSPIGGFDAEELARLHILSPDTDLYDALVGHYDGDEAEMTALMDKAAAFHARLSGWRLFAVSHSVPQTIWKLYRDTGYYDYAGSLRGGILRQANLRMLVERAQDYEETDYRGLFRFLRFIEEMKKRETDLSAARTLGASENVVRLMTIHKSKGLEFPVVFLADLGKQFNLLDARDNFLIQKDMGIAPKLVERSEAGRQIYPTLAWKLVRNQIIADSEAEEMRVLYVAMTRAREKLILTGAVGKKAWDRFLAKVGKLSSFTSKQFPDTVLRSAMTYYDWILTALLRHADGAPLREAAGVTSYEDQTSLAPLSHFAVSIVPASSVVAADTAEGEEDAMFSAIRAHEPLPSTEAEAQVESCLSFAYDTHGLSAVPAKVSVTEIKERLDGLAAPAADMEEQVLPSELLVKSQPSFRRPRFLQQKTGLSAAELGTYTHTIMQHLDLACDLSDAGLAAQLDTMVQKGWIDGTYLTKRLMGTILGRLKTFVTSGIAGRMKRARSIYRELPFSRMLPARQFFPEVETDDEIFIQGVLDILFQDETGRYVLLDYKTDHDTDHARAADKYKVQIAVYGEAVEALLGVKVEERYLYLLRDGSIVDMGKFRA